MQLFPILCRYLMPEQLGFRLLSKIYWDVICDYVCNICNSSSEGHKLRQSWYISSNVAFVIHVSQFSLHPTFLPVAAVDAIQYFNQRNSNYHRAVFHCWRQLKQLRALFFILYSLFIQFTAIKSNQKQHNDKRIQLRGNLSIKWHL